MPQILYIVVADIYQTCNHRRQNNPRRQSTATAEQEPLPVQLTGERMRRKAKVPQQPASYRADQQAVTGKTLWQGK